MKKQIKLLIQVFLVVVFCFCSVNLIARKVDLAKTDEEISEKRDQTRTEELHNDELEDMLSEENEEDLYRLIAEQDLNLAERDEKIYKKVPKN